MTAKVSAAFVAAQKDMTDPTKTAKANYGNFAPLIDCMKHAKEALHKHGLAVAQPAVSTEDGGVGCQTLIVHESGEILDLGTFTVTPSKRDPQGQGGALTYARRYALTSALGMVADDDDDGDDASSKATANNHKAEMLALRKKAEKSGTLDAFKAALENAPTVEAATAIYAAMSDTEKAALAAIAEGTVADAK